MSIIESAVTWAIGIANDNTHGYSQNVRWGPSYDCSSLVISAYQQAGVPVKTRGATYTGNMRSTFKACGFVEIPRPWTTSTLKRGDVLLNEVQHTAMYIGNGLIVHARSGEGTSDTYDNSGNEIRTQSYYDGGWDVVLRYNESTQPSTEKPSTSENTSSQTVPTGTVTKSDTISLPVIRNGSKGKSARAMQLLLIGSGYSCGSWGADGDIGSASINALKLFQAANGLTSDGVCGAETWKKLLGA